MTSRIWDGRCEDCYDKKLLHKCDGHLTPLGVAVELCNDCIRDRMQIQMKGLPQPDIGLLLEGIWVDAPSFVAVHSGKRMGVSVKFLTCSESAGMVRIRFDDRPIWLTGGTFSTSPAYAISEAKSFLRMFYFPRSPIHFE